MPGGRVHAPRGAWTATHTAPPPTAIAYAEGRLRCPVSLAVAGSSRTRDVLVSAHTDPAPTATSVTAGSGPTCTTRGNAASIPTTPPHPAATQSRLPRPASA